MITEVEWWKINSARFSDEPEPGRNKQLCPENYAADETASASLEDYRRTVLSLPYRSLKDKTQVFPLDQEHFVRTRLTHSQEVAINAGRIFNEVMSRCAEGESRTARASKKAKANDGLSKTVGDELGANKDTLFYSLMAACLFHDAGNPPFGHFGEQAIREWFQLRERKVQASRAIGKVDDESEGATQRYDDLWVDNSAYAYDLKCYEGNANSLHIALRKSNLYDGRRFNYTATTLGALIKYPVSSESWVELHSRVGQEADCSKAKFNFFASDGDDIKELSKFDDTPNYREGERHPLSFIMEAADDISNVTADFEDSFRYGCFSVGDALKLLLPCDDEPDGRFAAWKPFTFTLFCLLAIIAGDKQDMLYLESFYAQLPSDCDTRKKLKNNSVYDFEAKTLKPNSASILEQNDHTFRKALGELTIDQNGQGLRQLQETYIARWCDIVRRWLCFTVAQNISKEANASKLCKSIDSEEFERTFYGEHAETVRAIRLILKHFVYHAPDNIKRNLQARTVIHDLLDEFVPCVIRCADLVSLSDASPVDRELVNMIPLHIRLDCRDKCKAFSDNRTRCEYERIMAVLDYISEMTDGQIIQLHQQLF